MVLQSEGKRFEFLQPEKLLVKKEVFKCGIISQEFIEPFNKINNYEYDNKGKGSVEENG